MAYSNVSQINTKKKTNRARNRDELRKQRTKVSIELRKQQRSLQLEIRRHITHSLSDCEYSNGTNIPIDSIFEELKCELPPIARATDLVDFSRENETIGGNAFDENIQRKIRCLKAIHEMLLQENSTLVSNMCTNFNLFPKTNIQSSLFVSSLLDNHMIPLFVRLLNTALSINLTPVNICFITEMVATLATIACVSDKEQLQALSVSCVHQPLLMILSQRNIANADIKLWTNAFCCISFVAANNSELRSFVAKSDFISVISQHIEFASMNCQQKTEDDLNYMRSIAWSAKIIIRGNEIEHNDTNLRLLSQLFSLLSLNDDMITTNVIWTVSSIIEPSSFHELIPKDFILKLVGFTVGSNEEVKEAAITALANIASFSDYHALSLVNQNFLQHIGQLLNDNSSVVQKETVRILNNIISADPSLISQLRECCLFSTLLDLLHLGDYQTQKEITFLLRTIVLKGSEEDIVTLLNNGMIVALSIQLTINEAEVVQTTLEIYEHLLKLEKRKAIAFEVADRCEQSNVTHNLELLSSHPNEVLSNFVYKLFDEYLDHRDSSCGMDAVESSQTSLCDPKTGFNSNSFNF
ncbi:importin subunit alpha-3-like protein [Dinothrombium tinctorium]|uniref:Importin subunit alpha-3-like protein n=1 Tax=Dinothrombium tinctorium TaxID=1965070 RepID=A0A3S3RGC5_9ACAR|nr:importin subunit alpha-3-like protein [Dinothrombium tinctorium]RWS00662.1 importin subunit alpha-3-like protein [Dinothrombium tinctorium]